MSEISASLIKDLREKTGAGIVDCKKALVEAGADFEKAVDILRKTGAAKAEKKSGRITAEGRVTIKQQGNEAVLVEINCETDFVAKNPDFQNFVEEVGAHLLKARPAGVEELLASNFRSASLKQSLEDMILKIGENISIRRFAFLKAGPNEKIGSYIHMGNKIGVAVLMKGPEDQLSDAVLRDVAMHTAAASPLYLNPAAIPADALEREKVIYREQMKDLNKPANVLEKILEGKVARFADDVCLLNQAFVKDPTGKQSVAQYLKQVHPELDVVQFVRYQVGEGVVRKEEDFAAEVAKQLGS